MSAFSDIFQVKKQIPAQVLADTLPWNILNLLNNSALETRLINTFIKNNRDTIPYNDEELLQRKRYLTAPMGAQIEYTLSGDDIIAEMPLELFIGTNNVYEEDYIRVCFTIKKLIDKKAQNRFRDLLQDKIENKDRRTASEFNLKTDINKVCSKFLTEILSDVKGDEISVDDIYKDKVNKTDYLESFARTSLQKAFDIND